MRRWLIATALLVGLTACSNDDAAQLKVHCAELERQGEAAYNSARDQEFGELAAQFHEDCIEQGIGYGDVP